MNEDTELKIYELLGVNIFRKKILFTWEKIAKLLHINVGYRLEDYSTESFEEYKDIAKWFAIAHAFVMAFLLTVHISYSASALAYIFNIFMNSYCIMTQRYNYIRINKILEKKKIHDERIKIKKEQENINQKDKELNKEELLKLRESLINVESKEDNKPKILRKIR